MLAALLAGVKETHAESKAEQGPPRKRQKCTAHLDLAAAGGRHRFPIFPLTKFAKEPVQYPKPKARRPPPMRNFRSLLTSFAHCPPRRRSVTSRGTQTAATTTTGRS